MIHHGTTYSCDCCQRVCDKKDLVREQVTDMDGKIISDKMRCSSCRGSPSMVDDFWRRLKELQNPQPTPMPNLPPPPPWSWQPWQPETLRPWCVTPESAAVLDQRGLSILERVAAGSNSPVAETTQRN